MSRSELLTKMPSPRSRRLRLNTVLIAEDDPIFRRILESWFRGGTTASPRWKTDWMRGKPCNKTTLPNWRSSIG